MGYELFEIWPPILVRGWDSQPALREPLEKSFNPSSDPGILFQDEFEGYPGFRFMK